MKVSYIFDKDKILLQPQDISFQHIHSFVYGVSLEIFIGLDEDFPLLEVSKEYTLAFYDLPTSKFLLYEKTQAQIEDKTLTIYRFVKKIYKKILDNKLPNNTKILGVNFKKYVREKDNQLKFFIFELRKKSLVLINNEKLEPKQEHIVKLLTQPPKKEEWHKITEINRV